MRKRRAVLFDLDGTLVDSAPAIAVALSALRTERGAGPIGAGQVRPWISLGAVELVGRGLGECGRHPFDDLSAFRRALGALPTPPDSVYPGAADLLRALSMAGVAMAVVTNKPEALARKLLDDLTLTGYFGTIVGGDSVEACKPHPAPSLAALRALGAAPETAAFVGDSRIDAEAAAALALPFHLFEGGYGAAECTGLPVASRFAHHSILLETLVSQSVAAASGANP